MPTLSSIKADILTLNDEQQANLLTINVQFLRKIFHVMKIHLSYAIFNSSKMVFNSTPFWALR